MRQTQSMIMAVHTPIAPHPSILPRIKLKIIRKIHMEAMETIIVYFTSFAARRAFGSVKAAGHKSRGSIQVYTQA